MTATQSLRLSVFDALCALHVFERKGRPEAELIRKAVKAAALAAEKGGERSGRIIAELRSVAQGPQEGFLFPVKVDGIVLDALAILIGLAEGKPLDFWVKDASLCVLAGIHVTSEGSRLEYGNGGNSAGWVYGATLTDWANEKFERHYCPCSGRLEVNDQGFSLRVFQHCSLFDEDLVRNYSRTEERIDVRLTALATPECGAAAKRDLGLRLHKKGCITLSAEDAMELFAFSEKNAILQLGKVCFPIKAGFLETEPLFGWRMKGALALPVGSEEGAAVDARIELPGELFPTVAGALCGIHLPQDELFPWFFDLLEASHK